jgi:type I restriction enzyme S subunit
MTWYEVSLKQICDVDWGNTKLTKSSYVVGGKFLAVSAAGADGLINHYEHEANVPVLSAIGAQCGRMFFPGERFTAIKNTITLTPKAEVADGKFLYYLFTSVELPQRGAGQPFISKGDIEAFRVLIPESLEEQRQIVKKLDTAFAEIDLSYQKTTESLNYLSSCFDSFLDKILKNQILEFGLKKMIEVLDIARGGSPRPISSYLTNDKNGVNWVKISDATSSKKYITETSQKIKPEGVRRSRLVNPGDFLLSNSMSFGRPYIMGTTGCIHDGWLVLTNDKKLLNQDYLYYILGSKYIYDQFNRTAAGSTVRNLNISLAGQVTFPVPDLETQASLATQLIDFETSIDELKKSMADKLSKLLELKNSILFSTFNLNESSEAVA